MRSFPRNNAKLGEEITFRWGNQKIQFDGPKTCYMCCDFPPKFPQIQKISHERRSCRSRLFPGLGLGRLKTAQLPCTAHTSLNCVDTIISEPSDTTRGLLLVVSLLRCPKPPKITCVYCVWYQKLRHLESSPQDFPSKAVCTGVYR